MNASSARFLLAALLIVATAIFLQAHTHSENFPARLPLSAFPQQLGAWRSSDIPISRDVLDVLGPGDFLLRAYQYQEGHKPAKSRLARH